VIRGKFLLTHLPSLKNQTISFRGFPKIFSVSCRRCGDVKAILDVASTLIT
jgi:hypothetical protein